MAGKILPFIVVVVFLLAIAVAFFFPAPINYSGEPINGTGEPTQIAAQTVPTIVNGITTMTSIVLAFGAVMCGTIAFREVTKDNPVKKSNYFESLIWFIIPALYLYVSYVFLGLGWFLWAIRWALSAFLIAMMLLILFFITVSRILKSDAEKKSKEEKTENPFLVSQLKSEEKTEIEPTMQNAISRLAAICQIIKDNSPKIFMKKPEEVDEKILIELATLFPVFGTLFLSMTDEWNASKSKGIDAFQKTDNLDERIDIKLFESGKLDFQKMKKIMARLNRIDDALLMEEVINPYLKQYEYLCKEKKMSECLKMCNDFQSNFVERFTEHIRNERTRLKNQTERCNLYYQAKLNSRTVTIAWAALGTSIVSVVIAAIAILIKA